MNGERYYTTKIWERPSSIEFSSAGVLSTSMDPPGEPVISTWKRPCQKIQNGSEFPELVAQNFRNPQLTDFKVQKRWEHSTVQQLHTSSNWPAKRGRQLSEQAVIPRTEPYNLE